YPRQPTSTPCPYTTLFRSDIILVVNNWPQLYADSVADVSDVAEAIGNAQGGYYEISKNVANDGKIWIGVPWSIGGGLLTNRKSRSEEHTSELQSRVDLVCR